MTDQPIHKLAELIASRIKNCPEEFPVTVGTTDPGFPVTGRWWRQFDHTLWSDAERAVIEAALAPLVEDARCKALDELYADMVTRMTAGSYEDEKRKEREEAEAISLQRQAWQQAHAAQVNNAINSYQQLNNQYNQSAQQSSPPKGLSRALGGLFK